MSNDKKLSPGQRAKLRSLGVHPSMVGRTFNNVGTAMPETPEQLKEFLSDKDKILNMLKTSPADFQTVVQNYARTVVNRDKDFEAQVNEQVQKGLRDFLKENGQALTNRKLDLSGGDLGRALKAGAAYNKMAIGAPLDKEFSSVSDFLASVAPEGKRSPENRVRWERIRNDYSSVQPSAGGFLVPEVLRATLLSNSLENSIMRPGAMVIPMDGPRVPFPSIDETTHNGSVYGGITGTWIAEGEALPESQAKFGRVVLDASKLVSYCEVPSELPMDSPLAFGGFIDSAMPKALTFFEDLAFLLGDGVGKPLGVLNSGNTGLVVQAKRAGQAADTIHYENLVDMYSRMLPTSLGNAVWIAANDTFPELATMALSVGTGGSAVWLTNAVGPSPVTIFGRPVYFTEKVSKLGDQGDISFVDRGQYLLGDRMEMRTESSSHYKFGNDMIVYRVIERADGRPWMKSAVTPANGSTATMSPYVTLGERA